MVTHPSILLIEDSPGECELFRLALAQTSLAVTLHTEQDAVAAFRFLEDLAHHSQSTSQCSLSEVTGVVSTARVKRSQFIWSILSIWFVWLVRRETLPEEPDRPEKPNNQTDHRARSASTETMPVASPSLILLDLNLRGQDGCDFLKRLRSDPRFAMLPVVVFTTSDDPTDLARCYASGANGYVVKPGIFAELVQCIHDICRYWLDRNLTPHMIETKC